MLANERRHIPSGISMREVTKISNYSYKELLP